MAKVDLEDIGSLQNEVSVVATINANNNKTEAAIEQTLNRFGTAPNQMEVDFDMNGNRILNVADISLSAGGSLYKSIQDIYDASVVAENSSTLAQAEAAKAQTEADRAAAQVALVTQEGLAQVQNVQGAATAQIQRAKTEADRAEEAQRIASEAANNIGRANNAELYWKSYTATGVTNTYELGVDPGEKHNLLIEFDGASQNPNTWSLSEVSNVWYVVFDSVIQQGIEITIRYGAYGKDGEDGAAGPQGPQGVQGNPGPAGSGTGDMVVATYDPTGVNGDAFQFSNMLGSVTESQLEAALRNLLTPTGVINSFAGDTAPTGWFICNGQAVSRNTYSDLFALLGTSSGVGDGSTTFNLPDLRGEFLRGLDNGKGTDPSRVKGSNQSQEIQSHSHGISGRIEGIVSAGSNSRQYATENTVGTVSNLNTFAAGGSETRPRNIAFNFIIKA